MSKIKIFLVIIAFVCPILNFSYAQTIYELGDKNGRFNFIKGSTGNQNNLFNDPSANPTIKTLIIPLVKNSENSLNFKIINLNERIESIELYHYPNLELNDILLLPELDKLNNIKFVNLNFEIDKSNFHFLYSQLAKMRLNGHF